MRVRARILRKQSREAEQKLWHHLRNRQMSGAKFRRQHPVGPYFVDLCCIESRLVIELDGGHHASRCEQDLHRTRWLEAQGYRVLRFWNGEVHQQMEAVLEVIWNELRARAGADGVPARPSPPTPLPRAGEGRRASR